MNHPKNLWRLLRLSFGNPVEFFDRAEVIVLSNKEALFGRRRATSAYPGRVKWENGILALSGILGRDLQSFLDEPELHAMQRRIDRLTQDLEMQRDLPFPTVYNAKSTMMRLVYLLCRALEPETVVETGVAYGVSTAIILAALHKNRKGVLHSIDLPPIGARTSDIRIGMMVPNRYRGRWRLHLGSSKRTLPRLLESGVSPIDIFLHDSAQLYEIQRMELMNVWAHMPPRGVIIADSIHRNTAFAEFTREKQIMHSFAIEEQHHLGHLIGVILGTGNARSARPSSTGNATLSHR